MQLITRKLMAESKRADSSKLNSKGQRAINQKTDGRRQMAEVGGQRSEVRKRVQGRRDKRTTEPFNDLTI
jgi:hypothetical protein